MQPVHSFYFLPPQQIAGLQQLLLPGNEGYHALMKSCAPSHISKFLRGEIIDSTGSNSRIVFNWNPEQPFCYQYAFFGVLAHCSLSGAASTVIGNNDHSAVFDIKTSSIFWMNENAATLTLIFFTKGAVKQIGMRRRDELQGKPGQKIRIDKFSRISKTGNWGGRGRNQAKKNEI